MTNYEKYRSEIEEIWETEDTIALCDGEIGRCRDTECKECSFVNHVGNCSVRMAQWLVSEYGEPQVDWSKVKVDTPIFVRDNKGCKWQKRYFAKYDYGKVYAWECGCTSWTAESELDCIYWNYVKLAEKKDNE